MRAFVLVVILTLVMPATGAQDQPDGIDWIIWSDDGAEATRHPAGGDIDRIEAGATATGLQLRLLTIPSRVPPVAPSSEVAFQADQGGAVDVAFSWDDEARLEIGGAAAAGGWTVSEQSNALDWHLEIDWQTIGLDPTDDFTLEGLDAVATSAAFQDTATGPDLSFSATSQGLLGSVTAIQPGDTVEGPDFAGGTSITVDAAGRPLIAYYIYDAERGDPRGIYLATVADGGFSATRIDDVGITRDHGRDGQMRTQVAHDGSQAFVMFTDDPAVDNDDDGPGHLGTPDSVFVLARHDDAWQREDPTPAGTSDVGAEDVGDLVARAGKVVAAVPVGPDVWIMERTGDDQWVERGRLEGAHNAKLALDSEGVIHAAYVEYGPEGGLRDGTLYHASSQDGFVATHIGDNIDAGWEEPETDGSFAIAVGPDDQVAVLWNDGRSRERDEEQRIKVRHGDNWVQDFVPLVPGHGNPQYTMRLGYTAAGALVAASGYGGTDTLAARAGGAWTTLDLPRYDVWDMAVAPSGSVFFGYTQPHGGTTVAVTAYGIGIDLDGDMPKAQRAAQDEAPELAEEIPSPALYALFALLVVALARRR